MALRPGCFNEPVRYGPGQVYRRRKPGLLVVAVTIASLCMAMPSESMARPQQPELPASEAQAHVQGALQTSQSVVDTASASAKNSEWRGVVHSWPGHSSQDQLRHGAVFSSDLEATWLNQRTSRDEKTPNLPAAQQPAPPTAPLGASLQAVATQLMTQAASQSPTPTPESPPAQPDPAVRINPDDGFKGVAEPLEATHEVTHEAPTPSSPAPPSTVLPSSLKPLHQRPLPLTTIQPQPSTTASERISTWILLSGPHGTSTTPSATTFTSIPPSGSITSSAPQKKTPAPSSQPPKAAPQKPAAKRPANPNQATRKPVALTKKPQASTTTTTTTTAAAPSSTAPPTELVKVAETVQKTKLPATTAEQTGKKPGKPSNGTAATKRPTTASTPSATTPTAVTTAPVEKTKVSAAAVPFTTAIAFRRRPDAKHRVTTLAPVSSTTSSSTTLAPTTVEELTTLPSTLPDDAVTTTKRPKRPSTSNKKNKKKKNRRRRPAKKTTTAVATTKPESKVEHDSNISKPGPNGISSKIYNYLAREVMPSVSVGIIGLVVTAGLAGLFLYPFGGGVAARRHDEHLGPHGRIPPDRNYYYERDYPAVANEGNANSAGKAEEEIIGQVFAGMKPHQTETRYGYGPPIYGGGNGPPDAQYSENYDKPHSPSEPEEERPGEGEIKMYADPSPISSVSDSLQKTRYDVDHVSADQVDITYPPTKKEDSPYVVGSIAADDASRYHYAGNANATVDSTEENHKTPGSRYSVRVSGESGQVAVGYGAQSGATGSVENADLSSSLELSYTGTGAAQPRRLKVKSRRRRQAPANVVDSEQNELDGPVPEDKVYFTSSPPVTTTEVPTTIPTTEEVPSTTTISSAGKEVIVEVIPSGQASAPQAPTTAKVPTSTVFVPPAQPTDDPLASLVGLLKRLAEYKLRLGANFLRGTSDALTRYLGGVARRMEAAVEHLSENRSRRRARRWEPFHISSAIPKEERAPPPSRAKHIFKKATLTKKWQ